MTIKNTYSTTTLDERKARQSAIHRRCILLLKAAAPKR